MPSTNVSGAYCSSVFEDAPYQLMQTDTEGVRGPHLPPATWHRCPPPTRPTEAASRKQSRKPAGVESPQARKPSRVGEGKRSVYKGAEGVGDIQAQISLEKPKFAQVNFTNGLHITPVQVQ